jgi:hypothetical protein
MQIHVGDHVCTCHCGAKKEHDSAVNQIADLLRTTTKVTTNKVARSRGQRCRDIELAAFLADAAGPINLVMDLRIAHECLEVALILAYTTFAIPFLLTFDKPLNDAAAEKVREYRADYNNRPSDSI